jgi:YidC/Oxa1 family membrane protein insertase
MQELQEKYKDNPEQLSKKTMELLKKDGAWPLKWCLGMLIQMPVFLGLYAVVSNIADTTTTQNWMKFPTNAIDMVYSFFYPYVHVMIDTANLTTNFFWVDVLSKNHIWLAIVWWVLMFINMKIMGWTKPASVPTVPGANMPDMTKMMWFMNYFLVFMIGTFIYSTAAGVGLYIITSTLFGALQIYYPNRILVHAKIQLLLKWAKDI